MKSFDILGGSLFLYHENSNTLKTNFGSLLSFVTLILLVLAFIAFGQNFFNRTNPLSSISTVSAVDYPIYNITNKNFSIGFRFEDFDNIQYIEDDVLYFEVMHTRDVRDKQGVFQIVSRNYLPISVCNKEKFSGDPSFANTGDLQNILCVDFNGYDLGGNWDGQYVARINFNVVVCEEGKINPHTKKPCKPDSEKEKIRHINMWMISFYYQYTIIDTSSYDNSLRTIIKNDYFKLDKYLQKTKYMFFKETQLISDYGWIIKDKQMNFVLGFSSASTDFNAKESILGKPLSGFLAQYIIYGSRETDVITREYIKIQTLIAEVGGVIKFFLVVFSFVGNKYAYIDTVLRFKNLLCYDFNQNYSHSNNFQSVNNNAGLDISKGNLVSAFKTELDKGKSKENYLKKEILEVNNVNNQNQPNNILKNTEIVHDDKAKISQIFKRNNDSSLQNYENKDNINDIQDKNGNKEYDKQVSSLKNF